MSNEGKIVEKAILQIPDHYENVSVDKYCIMPDHVHLLLSFDASGRIISAPTLSNVVGSMKRWVSKQIGRPVWQKSFYEHSVRNQADYDEIWGYIEKPFEVLLAGLNNIAWAYIIRLLNYTVGADIILP